MAKFTNKKEQVYDIKLTSYGHHLMSIGEFAPEYYAFFDDNVIYDIEYTFQPVRTTVYDLVLPWEDNCSVYNGGPQAWWRLNTDVETTGSVFDSTGHGYNGTFDYTSVGEGYRPVYRSTRTPPADSPVIQTGSNTFQNLETAGTKWGTAIDIGTAETWNEIIGSVTGSGGYTLSTKEMSFAAWVYKTGDSNYNILRILDFGSSDISFYITNDEKVWFKVLWDGAGVWWNTAAAAITENAWHHVVVTYSAISSDNDATIYINGSSVSVTETGTAPAVDGVFSGISTPATEPECVLGNKCTFVDPFVGNLADVAVWNRILSATEVSLIYNASQGAATACSAWTENQNNVDNRIKNETQYLESLVLFEDVDDYVAANAGENIDPLSTEATWVQRLPRKDIFKMDAAIGDAFLDAEANSAPAWKVAALQSTISSSYTKDIANGTLIPQVNVVANYHKRIVEDTFEFDPSSMREMNDGTQTFIDGNLIVLEADDPVFYIEEVNTTLLHENFEIEVFGYVDTSGSTEQLERKYFRKDIPQIVDGFLVSETKETVSVDEVTSGSVEYYFDVLTDRNVERDLACKGALGFDKSSYYIDLDFECDDEEDENVFYDIYGSVTEEPEICLD